jgi:serine protease Do
VQGQGSGFIISADGTVLTNAHVVAEAKEVTVKLTDRREFTAKVVGLDKATDVAVLRIEGKNLPTVKLGDSRKARVGDWVLAIGSPFGLENTVTAGIISSKSRSLPGDGYVPFIQTDVAINPGNSGGPLFNLAGEVIGINSQIYSRSGGYQGLSFAIPIETARRIEEQLVSTGKVSRGRLGVAIQELNASLAESFGLDKVQGALVNSVEKGGPADKAGVKAGDVILKLNGNTIASSSELPSMVSEIKAGTQARLDVWRDGKPRSLNVTIGEFPSTAAAAAAAPAARTEGRLGLAVRPLTAEEKKQAELSNGVVVENVSGAAARAGIEAGDVILRANGTEIANAEALRAQVAKAGKRVALLVQRGEQRMFVPVDIG